MCACAVINKNLTKSDKLDNVLLEEGVTLPAVKM